MPLSTPTRTALPRRRPAVERRRAILDAARGVLASRDYHSVTMDDVARRAELSKGSLYLHFPTKEKLFGALAEDLHARLWTRWTEVSAQTAAGAPRLKALLFHQLQHFEENRALFFQVFLGQLPWQCHPRKSLAEVIDQNVNAMAEVIKDGMRLGHFAPGDPHLPAVGLFGLIRGFVFTHIVGGKPGALTRRADDIWRLFYKGAEP